MTKNKCILLFRTQMKNELGRNIRSRGRTAMAFVMGILVLILVVYSFLIGYGLSSAGLGEVVPSYGIAITGLIVLFFTALKSNGVLFAYSEYDMLMALPIKTDTVIASRFLTMYVMNLFITAAVLIPMGIGYAVYHTPGPVFYLEWFLGILAAPLIPTTLASLLGTLIIWFSSRFKYANAAVTIVSLLATIGILVLLTVLGGMNPEFDMTRLYSISEVLLEQIHRLYPPAILFYDGVSKGNAMAFAAFFIISLIWYYLFIKLLSPVYRKLNTALMTFHARSDFKMGKLKASSQLSALYKKELKRFFSSTIYCLNMGIGNVMAILTAAACFFVGEDQLKDMLGSAQIWEMAVRCLPFVISTWIALSCSTSVSLSLEGKSLWIIKSMPIDDITIYKSKILLNLSLQIPTALLTALLVNIRFTLPLPTRIFMFATPLAYALFTSLWGMFINLKMPDYTWTSETALIKQSMPAMAGIFGGMAAGIIPVFALIALYNVPAGILTAGITAAVLAAALGLWRAVRKLKI